MEFRGVGIAVNQMPSEEDDQMTRRLVIMATSRRTADRPLTHIAHDQIIGVMWFTCLSPPSVSSSIFLSSLCPSLSLSWLGLSHSDQRVTLQLLLQHTFALFKCFGGVGLSQNLLGRRAHFCMKGTWRVLSRLRLSEP